MLTSPNMNDASSATTWYEQRPLIHKSAERDGVSWRALNSHTCSAVWHDSARSCDGARCITAQAPYGSMASCYSTSTWPPCTLPPLEDDPLLSPVGHSFAAPFHCFDMTALAASTRTLGASNTGLVGSVESPALGDQHLALLGMCYGPMPL